MPDGLIHHWIGTVLIPGVPLERVLAFVKNYAAYPVVFGPSILSARVIADRGIFSMMILSPIFYGVFYPQPYLGQLVRKIPIAVPAYEHHLFADVENFWRNRRVYHEGYETRNDYYSLTASVPVAAKLVEWRRVGGAWHGGLRRGLVRLCRHREDRQSH